MTEINQSPQAAPVPLQVLVRLVSRLDSEGIRYCHWKSNEHLADAMAGNTDVDLLVDPAHMFRFDDAARQLGFVEALAPSFIQLPGVRHLYSLDSSTGRLAHVHVHDRLVLGELRVKNHRLPVEGWLLDHRIHKLGVPIPEPRAELLLLYVRSLMKTTLRASARTVAGRQEHPFPKEIRGELADLLDQVDDDAVVGTIDEAQVSLDPAGLAEFIRRVRADDIPVGYVLAARRRLRAEMRPYRRYGPVVAAARKVWLRLRFSRPWRVFSPLPAKRPAGGGLIIGVVGADGSGKTTLTHDLVAWLSRTLRTEHVYFGQPKNDLILHGTRRVNRRLRNREAGLGRGSAAFHEIVRTFQWLYIAVRRRRTARLVNRLQSRGGLVVAERYPLPEFWKMENPMDGPRLGTRRRGPAYWERRIYEAIPRPDLILVLRADLAALKTRKPLTPEDEVFAKHTAVERLIETHDPALKVLDADRPYEEVLHAAKLAIWDSLVSESATGVR